MSYSDGDRRVYTFPAVNFGSSSAQSFKGPKGKAGRLIDVHVSATTTFTAVTTSGLVDIGTAATTNANARFSIGTLAATDAACGSDGTTNPTWLINPNIAANTQVEVTFTAPTGGSPAGVGTVSVTVEWDW